jgi:hypothetical protein
LIVSYATKALRESCVKREQADEAFGPSAAQSLFRMLADVEAAENASEVLSLYEGAVEIAEGDSLSINFAPECHAKFDPVDVKRKGCDVRDWAQVQRLKLTHVQVSLDE